MQNKAFSINKTLNLRGELIDLSIPKVMGILNVTPDSFYDGGRHTTDKNILNQTEKMLSEGADIIDIGGYSSRPGASDISPAEEMGRVLPACKMISREFPSALISVDTFRAEVARQAVQTGAAMVNDISGGSLDPMMFETVASLRVPYCMMHMRGNPETMVHLTSYENILTEIVSWFQQKLELLRTHGINDVIVDPGFGFSKTREQNFCILERLNYFKILGQPILAGLSRKSMIWKTLNTTPDQALNGTTALNTIALERGACILRVHDVKEATESIQLAERVHDAAQFRS